MPQARDDRITVSVPEGCRLTDLSRSKLLELVYDGSIPSLKIGRRRLILVDGLRRYLDSCAASGSPLGRPDFDLPGTNDHRSDQ